MPQFILDMGSPEAAADFAKLDAFTRGYIEAMFFTSAGPDHADEGLADPTVRDLGEDVLASIVWDCADFQKQNAGALGRAYERDYTAEQAGHDYWFTRNGHGVSYWDREQLAPETRNALGGAAFANCECTLYRRDDGYLDLD